MAAPISVVLDLTGNNIKCDNITGGATPSATATVAGTVKKSATVAAVASANAGATYTSAEQTLINEIKTQLNLLIANSKTSGQLS